MLDLASHILDIAENSVRAGAEWVEINIVEDDVKNVLVIEINDNGCGMTKDELQRVSDPFYTTKTVRRIGLGIPLLAEAAERTGGRLHLESQKGVGTRLRATFQLDNIDRQPMGDLSTMIVALIAGNASVDFIYNHTRNDHSFSLDTRQIRAEIEDIPIHHPDIIKYIRNAIQSGLDDIQPNE